MSLNGTTPTPELALCIDWETSGSTWGGDSSIDYQGLSFGAAVVRLADYEVLDTLYAEIKFDDTKYQWADTAEKIHGLSREYLAKNGMTQEAAAELLLNFIVEHFGTTKIVFIGHNMEFDVRFTAQLLATVGFAFGKERIPGDERPRVGLHHVCIDTASVGLALTQIFKSDILFGLFAGADRGAHNALEDVLITVETLKNIKILFQSALGEV